MSPAEAREILEALADGIDPETGEVLPEKSPYNSPRVLRALFAALKALAASTATGRRNPDLPSNSGRPWTADEDDQLLSLFDGGLPLKEIAARHGRSSGGVASRLVRLGRLRERSEAHDRRVIEGTGRAPGERLP